MSIDYTDSTHSQTFAHAQDVVEFSGVGVKFVIGKSNTHSLEHNRLKITDTQITIMTVATDSSAGYSVKCIVPPR